MIQLMTLTLFCRTMKYSCYISEVVIAVGCVTLNRLLYTLSVLNVFRDELMNCTVGL